jgi:hypothetical protein
MQHKNPDFVQTSDRYSLSLASRGAMIKGIKSAPAPLVDTEVE